MFSILPIKTNIAPENQWLEDSYFPIELVLFLGTCLFSRGTCSFFPASHCLQVLVGLVLTIHWIDHHQHWSSIMSLWSRLCARVMSFESLKNRSAEYDPAKHVAICIIFSFFCAGISLYIFGRMVQILSEASTLRLHIHGYYRWPTCGAPAAGLTFAQELLAQASEDNEAWRKERDVLIFVSF